MKIINPGENWFSRQIKWSINSYQISYGKQQTFDIVKQIKTYSQWTTLPTGNKFSIPSLSLSGRQVIKSLDYAGAEPSTPKCSASNDDFRFMFL